MASPRYIVGIDLGTTNCVVGYLGTRDPDNSLEEIPVFQIPQLIDAGRVAGRPKLPSFLYLPSPHELPRGSLALPWDLQRSFMVGEFARNRGSQSPGRLVSSAKSWLCHSAVDRTASILPWGAHEEVDRLSPVHASSRYLAHIRETWDHQMASKEDSARLEKQEIILTVPASFDEVARELTVEAARLAGLERVTLIEEPQAAFYSWLFEHRESWQKEVRPEQLILVCDVGGGTTDFTLIQVEAKNDQIGFRRIAVGDHLLLGGDNMDLALAAELEPALVGKGRKLDSTQWSVLRHACRSAKEALLSGAARERVSVAIPGRGSALVGGSLSGQLTRDQVSRCILEGFFPMTGPHEMPRRTSNSALQEFGLPFEQDPAVSRHLAAFLHAPPDKDVSEFRRPHHVLFNGGVFKAEKLQKRVIALLKSWFPGKSGPKTLDADGDDLDLAVARGAAYSGLVRRGRGVRIAGGTARSFYLGLETPQAVRETLLEDPIPLALCIAPQGLDEGEEIGVPGKEFELLIRQPVSFPFYSSRSRPMDKVGDLVSVNPDSVVALPPVRTVLSSGKKAAAERVRVRLHAVLTEVGTLEVWCVENEGGRRWRLQFEVRKDLETESAPVSTSGEVGEEYVLARDLLDRAAILIRQTFLEGAAPAQPGLRPEKLMKNLEAALEKGRHRWPVGALRELWKPFYEVAEQRKGDPACEIRWLNLGGFLLRPGHGYPLDDWRIKQLWRIFDEGVCHGKSIQVRVEWWILWRRVAGGLSRAQQAELFRRISPALLPEESAGTYKSRPRRVTQEETEMWRAAASLERIPAKERRRLGEALMAFIERGEAQTHDFWTLGRLGARIPFYGPLDTVVSREAVELWIEKLLERGQLDRPESLFALVELARCSGDRERDIEENLRARVLEALRAAGAGEHLQELVSRVASLREEEQNLVFGETLPPALRLVTSG